MKATLYLPGQAPTPVILSENTREAAARVLGVCPAIVFEAADVFAGSTAPGWCDYHGRFLLLDAA